jgi:hypothetical protein
MGRESQRKIEELERRVRELERRQAAPVVPYPWPQPWNHGPWCYCPWCYPYYMRPIPVRWGPMWDSGGTAAGNDWQITETTDCGNSNTYTVTGDTTSWA